MKKYLNHHGYSDVTPFEVIRVISPCTVEIRQMDAVLDPKWAPDFKTGGFAANCPNQSDQAWIITSNPNGRVIRVRKSKKGWGKGAFREADEPRRFYDYNF